MWLREVAASREKCLSYWDKNWSFGWFSSSITELGYEITDQDNVKLHFFVLKEVKYDLRWFCYWGWWFTFVIPLLWKAVHQKQSMPPFKVGWSPLLCIFMQQMALSNVILTELQWHQHERWCLWHCLQLGKGDKPFLGREVPWRLVMAYDLPPLKNVVDVVFF